MVPNGGVAVECEVRTGNFDPGVTWVGAFQLAGNDGTLRQEPKLGSRFSSLPHIITDRSPCLVTGLNSTPRPIQQTRDKASPRLITSDRLGVRFANSPFDTRHL